MKIGAGEIAYLLDRSGMLAQALEKRRPSNTDTTTTFTRARWHRLPNVNRQGETPRLVQYARNSSVVFLAL